MYQYKESNTPTFENCLGHELVVSPTGNCQMSSLRDAHNVFTLSQKNAVMYLRELRNICCKKILLVDLNDVKSYTESVEKIFANGFIIAKTPYESTNESKMVLYLLNLDALYAPQNQF